MSVTFLLLPLALAVLGGVGGIGAMAVAAETMQGRPGSFGMTTRMRDPELLRQAIEKYGYQTRDLGEVTAAALEGRQVLFQPGQNGAYQAVFTGDTTQEQARSILDGIDEQYTRLVQGRVYENLMARARERGMVLETEEVQADNSITLTFAVA